MVTEKIFETALGISSPWFIAGMGFDEKQRTLRIRVDFEVGSRFAVPGQAGEHPVHDTVTKTYRHLNFFQYQCDLTVRVPRVKLPDGKVIQVIPPWAGKLSGFSLLFEAFVLLLARETTFTGASRISGLSVHRVMALCARYVNEALSEADFSEVRRVALDETSRAKGQEYVTLFADADPDPARRRVIFVAEGKDATTVEAFAANLRAHSPHPSNINNFTFVRARLQNPKTCPESTYVSRQICAFMHRATICSGRPQARSHVLDCVSREFAAGATYELQVFEQTVSRVLGPEPSGRTASNMSLVQAATHHLRIRRGVAMSGGDLSMPEPRLDFQQVNIGLQQDHRERVLEHVRRNRRSGKFGSTRRSGDDGATHDVGSTEARERPSLGADE